MVAVFRRLNSSCPHLSSLVRQYPQDPRRAWSELVTVARSRRKVVWSCERNWIERAKFVFFFWAVETWSHDRSVWGFFFCCANYTRKWYDLSGRSYGENLPAVGTTNLQEFFGQFLLGVHRARSVSEFDSQREEAKGRRGCAIFGLPPNLEEKLWKIRSDGGGGVFPPTEGNDDDDINASVWFSVA